MFFILLNSCFFIVQQTRIGVCFGVRGAEKLPNEG